MTRVPRWFLGLTPLVIGLLVWQVIGQAESPYAPKPSTWLPALNDLPDGALSEALRATITTFFEAIAVAIVVGMAIGMAIGTVPRLERATRPLLELGRSMPPPAVVPAAALVLGFGRGTAIAAVVMSGIWPIVLNTVASVNALPPIMLDAAGTLRLSTRDRIVKVLVPALVPGLLLGIRIATPVCVIITLLVEMLTGADGIGTLLIQAERNFLPAQAFGLLVVVGAFGLIANGTVVAVERRVLRAWPPLGHAAR